MNPWLHPVFALLFSTALFGYIMDKKGYCTTVTDEDGNEIEYSIYKILLENFAFPLFIGYLAVVAFTGWIAIPFIR